MSHLIWVDCEVNAGGRRADRKRAEVFFQRGAKWDDYDVVMYLFGPDPMPGTWPTIERKLKQLHTTTLSSYPLELCKYANFSVQAQTRISGQDSPDGELRNHYNKMKKDYLATGNKHLLVRECCLNDPEYLNLQAAELHDLCAPWVPFSPMSYYIYEEPSLTCYGDACDICFGPHCLAAMRKWLAGEYGSLEKLNQVWGTLFESWEAVEPDDAPQAQARGNYASWADHRTFMEISYADNYDHVARTLRQIDPTGMVLNSGTQISGSHNGCDYWRLNKILGHLNPYSGDNQMDFHRTFGDGLKLSAGMGYGRSGREVPHGLYSNLFNGSWAGSYVFWQYSMLDPDLTFCQSALDTREGFDEIVGQGIARLFKNLPRGHDNIAIHYSMASTHGTWIVDGKVAEQVTYNTSRAFQRFRADRDGWVNLLKDLGCQYDFLAYEEIEKDALEQGGYQVLILPMSVALSNAEAAAIRRFVEGGGTLICDRFTGVMDDHCRWRETGALDDVLGLERTRKAAPGDYTSEGPDPDLKSKGAKAAGSRKGIPVGWTHSYGRGNAFTLGYLLDNYVAEARDGLAGQHRDLVAGTLSAAGVHPSLSLTTPEGEQVSGVAAATFDNGDCTLVGLVRSNEGPLNYDEILVRLPGAQHIYDVRRGTYLGYSDRVLQRLATGEPTVLALVPEKLSGPTLEAPKTAARGSEYRFQVQLTGSLKMHNVAVVEVITPSGKRHELYSTRIDLGNGRGEGWFTPALDDPEGVWKLQVKEVIGGQSTETLFTLGN